MLGKLRRLPDGIYNLLGKHIEMRCVFYNKFRKIDFEMECCW